jgi:hypothetical protein
MWADTPAELHAMASRIGLKRGWFQDDPRLPHYDLTIKRKAAAVKAGAQQASLKAWIRFRRGLAA